MKLSLPIGGHIPEKPEFAHSLQTGDLSLTLTVATRRQPVGEWVALRPDAAGPISMVLAAAEDDRLDPDGKTLVEVGEVEVLLRPAFVASLDEAAAAALGLPSATSLALELKPIGRIDQD